MFRNMLATTVILLIGRSVLAAEGATKPAAEKRPTKIWNRTGPLGDTPKHVTDDYPLSDQQNEGGWVKYDPMSDEFEGDKVVELWRPREQPLRWDILSHVRPILGL